MTTILQWMSEKISLGPLDEEIEKSNNWTEDVVFPRTSPRLVIQSALETNTHATERLSKLYFYADWFMLTMIKEQEATVRSQAFRISDGLIKASILQELVNWLPLPTFSYLWQKGHMSLHDKYLWRCYQSTVLLPGSLSPHAHTSTCYMHTSKPKIVSWSFSPLRHPPSL